MFKLSDSLVPAGDDVEVTNDLVLIFQSGPHGGDGLILYLVEGLQIRDTHGLERDGALEAEHSGDDQIIAGQKIFMFMDGFIFHFIHVFLRMLSS